MAKTIKEPEKEPDEIPEKEIEEKIDVKTEKAVKKGASKKEVENIIGEITPPDDDAGKKEWREYFKSIDAKLDRLLSPPPLTPTEEPQNEEPEPEPEPKAPWYDKEFF